MNNVSTPYYHSVNLPIYHLSMRLFMNSDFIGCDIPTEDRDLRALSSAYEGC